MHPPRYIHTDSELETPPPPSKLGEIISDPISHLTILEKPLHRFIIHLLGITPAHEHVRRTVGSGIIHSLAVTIAGLFLLGFFGSLDDTVAKVSFLI